MRNWIFTFLILTVIAGLVGFTQLATMVAQFSQNLFVVFAVLFAVTLLFYILKKSPSILSWVLIFFAVSCVSGVLAFTNLTSAVVYIAKLSFYLFLALLIIFLVIHSLRKRS